MVLSFASLTAVSEGTSIVRKPITINVPPLRLASAYYHIFCRLGRDDTTRYKIIINK